MVDKQIIVEILNSREERALEQKRLIDEYGSSLISFTLNIPGAKKDSPKYRDIHEIGMKKILSDIKDKSYKILYSKSYHKNSGSEGFIVVDVDPFQLKKLTINIEETHHLGRIFDIDVLDISHNQISRRDLGVGARKCLICSEDAKVCSRRGRHSIEELLERIDKLYKGE